VAESELRKDLRSAFFSGMLRVWEKHGATADNRSAASRLLSYGEFIGAHPTSSRWKRSPATMRGAGVEAGQRRLARHGLSRAAADAGAGRRDRVAAGAPPHSKAVPDGAPATGSDLDRHDPAGDAAEVARSDGDPSEPLFNGLMERYLRYEQPVGEHLKYLAFAQGRPIACLAWSSAPRHLGSRDRFIAYNTRFLILPWVGVPHLASPILGKGGSPPGEAKTTGPTGPTARLRKSSACRWRPVSASSSASYENDISDGCECTGRANRMERSSKRCCTFWPKKTRAVLPQTASSEQAADQPSPEGERQPTGGAAQNTPPRRPVSGMQCGESLPPEGTLRRGVHSG
jgi:hypothetical protein